jgi:hypothetical protein
MEVDGVPINSADGIVLAKDVVGRLFVVGIGRLTMSLSLFGELMSSRSIPSGIRMMRLVMWVMSEDILSGIYSHTRSRREDFCPCSCLANERRRSYSASALLLWL